MNLLKQTTLILAICVLAGPARGILAQTTSVLVGDLNSPTKMITAIHDSLLVAEAGAEEPNTGRLSVVNRRTGERQTLLNGLPSGNSNLGGPPEPSGPSSLVLRGRTLYLTIATGDALINVGPGLETSNTNPSSPIFNSVLELKLPANFARISSPFTLAEEDQNTLADGGEVNLTNADDQELGIRMIVNLPDSMPNPRPDAPNNLRASNVFGIELHQRELYVADASFNLVYRVSIFDGQYVPFATFPSKPNPLFPNMGGPTVESVPNNIHRVGNLLLVPQLTGFPFVPGLSEIQSVKIKSGQRASFIPGLTSAMDILHAGGDRYYTLEFSADMLTNQLGRLKFFSSPDADPVVVVDDLTSPTSMALDEETGDIYVTEIFTGRIIRVAME